MGEPRVWCKTKQMKKATLLKTVMEPAKKNAELLEKCLLDVPPCGGVLLSTCGGPFCGEEHLCGEARAFVGKGFRAWGPGTPSPKAQTPNPKSKSPKTSASSCLHHSPLDLGIDQKGL